MLSDDHTHGAAHWNFKLVIDIIITNLLAILIFKYILRIMCCALIYMNGKYIK